MAHQPIVSVSWYARIPGISPESTMAFIASLLPFPFCDSNCFLVRRQRLTPAPPTRPSLTKQRHKVVPLVYVAGRGSLHRMAATSTCSRALIPICSTVTPPDNHSKYNQCDSASGKCGHNERRLLRSCKTKTSRCRARDDGRCAPLLTSEDRRDHARHEDGNERPEHPKKDDSVANYFTASCHISTAEHRDQLRSALNDALLIGHRASSTASRRWAARDLAPPL